MGIYFTSDPHFGHENIIRFADRPFEDAAEMDRILLSNINARVRKEDTLYVLGDFCMGRGVDKEAYTRELLGKIECDHVILVLGNHDLQNKQMLESLGFDSVHDYLELKHEGNRFCLMHYPLAEWNGEYHGAYDLHGHSHNKRAYNEEQRKQGTMRYDVGVDANCYMPVSLDEILRFFEARS